MNWTAIFLDIDGVLVTLESFKRFKKSGISAQAAPPCVEQLNRILEATNAKIVLSSTWRCHGIRFMQNKFREWGIQRKIYSFTPDLTRTQTPGSALVVSIERGLEIQAWLDGKGKAANFGPPSAFVILDDDADMGPLLPHLIQCKFETGLTRELADETIRRLSR